MPFEPEALEAIDGAVGACWEDQRRTRTDTVFNAMDACRVDDRGPGVAGIAVSRLGGVDVEDDQALRPYRCVAPLVR